MRRPLALAALLATWGCGFAGAPGLPEEEDPDGLPDDGAADGSTPAVITDYCQDARIVLCLEFDEVLTDWIIQDGTVLEQTVIAEEFGGFIRDGGGVIAVDEDSLVEVAGNETLDVRGGFTVELWANLGLPAFSGPGGNDNSSTLIAAEGQFELSIMADGNVKCEVGNKDVKAVPGTVHIGTWHHYACTWDGMEIALYIDGVESKRDEHLDLSFGQSEPGNILIGAELDEGERDDEFTGAIDNLRLFMEALPPQEICSAGC
jgi:hypothetical protein